MIRVNTAIVAGWLYRYPHEGTTSNDNAYTELRLVEFGEGGRRNSVHVRAFKQTKERVDALQLQRGDRIQVQGFTIGFDWTCRCGRKARTQTILATNVDLLKRKDPNGELNPDHALDEFAEELLE